jgi:hypothetical protein
MILNVKHRDRAGNSGSLARRAERVELEGESAADLEALGELARVLAATGATTAAAVRDLLVAYSMYVRRPQEDANGRGYG